MIDSHHHFWNFTEEEFGWIPEDSIKKSFNTPELAQTLSGTNVTGAISVQARCSLEENSYLLEQSDSSDLIKGVVGWLDLKADDIATQAAPFLKHPKFKGVREITQGAADQDFFTNEKFNQGISQLKELGLTYDLLIFEDQLESANQFVQRHAYQPMVLDHCGKPSIRKNQFPTAWANGIKEIAKNPNLYCKLSGLVTEIKDGSSPSVELFQPYFDSVLEAFGPNRIMFGSDWPVSLMGMEYQAWTTIVQTLISSLSETEQQAISKNSVTKFYNL